MDATALLTHPSLPGLQLELGISLYPMAMAHAEPPTSLGTSLESCLDLIWISEQQELAMSADRQRWRGRKRALLAGADAHLTDTRLVPMWSSPSHVPYFSCRRAAPGS